MPGRTSRLVAICIVCCLVVFAGVALGHAPPNPGGSVTPIPATYRVPRSARVLEISRDSSKPRLIVVTDAAEVSRIARVLDGLSVHPTHPLCSEGVNFGPPTISFAFLAATGGRVLARTTGLDYTKIPVAGCILTRYSVRGKKQIFLIGGGLLIEKAEKILGRKLT